MQRYSLYIDHQLVSTLIRQLQNAVQTCYEELDEEYEPHQLRTHIYEEFVFHITTLYYSKYSIKEQYGLKEDDIKKYYELTSKLQGIGAKVKYEEVSGYDRTTKKGRPSKNQQAEDHLLTWIQQKISSQGKLHYTKKELDEVYLPLLQKKPKSFPSNNYFRMFKKHDLLDISIANRNGVIRSVRQFFSDKYQSSSFCKKENQEEDRQVFNQDGFQEQDLNSTSELQHLLEEQYEDSIDQRNPQFRSAKISNRYPFGWKPRPRSCKVVASKKDKKKEKQMEKSIKISNFFNEDSDYEKIDHEWQDLSMSNDFFEKLEPRPDIYDNSKSYE